MKQYATILVELTVEITVCPRFIHWRVHNPTLEQTMGNCMNHSSSITSFEPLYIIHYLLSYLFFPMRLPILQIIYHYFNASLITYHSNHSASFILLLTLLYMYDYLSFISLCIIHYLIDSHTGMITYDALYIILCSSDSFELALLRILHTISRHFNTSVIANHSSRSFDSLFDLIFTTILITYHSDHFASFIYAFQSSCKPFCVRNH